MIQAFKYKSLARFYCLNHDSYFLGLLRSLLWEFPLAHSLLVASTKHFFIVYLLAVFMGFALSKEQIHCVQLLHLGKAPLSICCFLILLVWTKQPMGLPSEGWWPWTLPCYLGSSTGLSSLVPGTSQFILVHSSPSHPYTVKTQVQLGCRNSCFSMMVTWENSRKTSVFIWFLSLIPTLYFLLSNFLTFLA